MLLLHDSHMIVSYVYKRVNLKALCVDLDKITKQFSLRTKDGKKFPVYTKTKVMLLRDKERETF